MAYERSSLAVAFAADSKLLDSVNSPPLSITKLSVCASLIERQFFTLNSINIAFHLLSYRVFCRISPQLMIWFALSLIWIKKAIEWSHSGNWWAISRLKASLCAIPIPINASPFSRIPALSLHRKTAPIARQTGLRGSLQCFCRRVWVNGGRLDWFHR